MALTVRFQLIRATSLCVAAALILCSISGPAPATSGTATIALSLTDASGETVDEAQISLDVRQPFETHRRTFLSGIDDSVQYYAVTPARPIGDDSGKPALFLTLHGAGVQALGQARAYSSKSWGHIVAATNRSPSCKENTPDKQAATYSPILWPIMAYGLMPQCINNFARAYSNINKTGWVISVWLRSDLSEWSDLSDRSDWSDIKPG